jgi:hypothetical protein
VADESGQTASTHPDRGRLALLFVPLAASGSAALVILAVAVEDPQTVFTVLAGVLAFLAVVAAALAVRLSWPQYDQWRRTQLARPLIRVTLAVAPNQNTMPEPVGQRVAVHPDQGPFVLRVEIHNDGSAPMRDAVLNIVVATTCDIRPIDPPAKTHYPSPLPGMSQEIVPGASMPVRWTVARADITSGDHVFHAEITPRLGVGPWPILVELTGDPSPTQRFTRVHAYIP